MTILDRNFGTFAAATSFTVTRSTGSYGTGTILGIIVFSNTVVSTPAALTQRGSSVVDLGLYGYDGTAAGQSSIAFTCSAGSGVWFAWEMNAGSTWVSPASLTQNNTGATSFATGSLTPASGNFHILAGVGGVGGAGNTRTVTALSNSFTIFGQGQALANDYPFAAGADVNVTGNGSTAFSTTATFSAGTNTARGGILMAFINNAGDVTAPSVPAGLSATAVGSTTADLSWSASTDDTAVTGYELQIIGP